MKDGKYCQLTFDGNGGVPLEWYQSNFAKDILLEELVKMAEKEVSSDGLAAKPTPMGILQGRLCSRLPIRSSDGSVKLCSDKRPQCNAATGGSAQSRLWLDICATTLNAEVFVADFPEPTCKGAAMIAK